MSSVTDTFTRATSGSLGTADTGQTWSTFGGAGMGINGSNQAATTAASADAGAVIDSGASDATYQVTIANGATGTGGLVFRFLDGNNFWTVQLVGSSVLYTRKFVAGSYTDVTNGITAADGDVFTVVCSGSSIIVKQNGSTVRSLTDSFNLTATKGGLLARPGAIYDNFSIANASGGGTPTQMTVGQQPVGGAATNLLATQPIFQVRDSGSVIVTGDTSTMSVVLNTISGTGTLFGTTSKACVAGQATFTDLGVSAPGTYTLTASDGTLPTVTTAQFTVSARSASPYINLATDGADIGFNKAQLDAMTAVALAGDRRSVTEVRYGGASQFFSYQSANRVQYPRTLMDTDTFPTRTGVVRSVNSDATFSAALTAAAPGDWIVVDHTVTYSGNYYRAFPVKAGDAVPGGNNVIVVISKAIYDSMVANGGVATVCPQKKRVSSADLSNLAFFRGSDSLSSWVVDGATNGWRFVGLRIGVAPTATFVSHLAALGNPDEGIQTNATQCPSNVGFDRCWFDGHATCDMRHCVELHCKYGYVIDSAWGDNVHIQTVVSSECHALIGYNGPGPFRIINNKVNGGSQSIFFGGAASPCGMPSDIEVRFNWMTRPVAWNSGIAATYDGSDWSIKCAFEIKKARFVLCEGNVVENIWPKGQAGALFLLKSESYGDGATIGYTHDVLVRWNLGRSAGFGINIASLDNVDVAYPADKVIAAYNLIRLGAPGFDASFNPFLGIGFCTNSGSIHNTFIADGQVDKSISLPDPAGFVNPNGDGKADGLLLWDSIYDVSNSGWKPSGGAQGSVAPSAPGGFTDKNVVVGASAGYPVTTYIPATRSAIVFTDESSGDFSLFGGGVTPPPTLVASGLVFLVQPGSTTDGVVLSPAPKVGVVDQFGAAFATTIAITLTPDAGVSVTAGGTVSTGGASNATFGALALTAAATMPTRLTASAPGLPSVTSNSFTITVPPPVIPPPVNPPGPSAQLAVVGQPGGAVSGLPMTTPPMVEIRDAQGFLVPTSSIAVTLSVKTTAGPTMPPTPVTANNGLVTFTPAILTGVGVVTLQATGPGLGTVVFAPVTVTSQPPNSTGTQPPQPFVRRRHHRIN